MDRAALSMETMAVPAEPVKPEMNAALNGEYGAYEDVDGRF